MEVDPRLRPPAGTIPVIRDYFEPYLSGQVKAESLALYIAALTQPSPNHNGNRLYGTHRDVRSNIGTNGYINIWKYTQVSPNAADNEMSLMQNAVICWGDNPEVSLEAIEAGIQVHPLLYGDSNHHVFTYFRTSGTGTGNLVGGYNEQVQGFKRAIGAPWAPGAAISGESTIGGSQYDFHFITVLQNNEWWVYAAGVWLGYYPTNGSTSVMASEKIPFDQIHNGACEGQWFGEVADPTPNTWTNANMGSGLFVAGGFGQAAYIREPFLQLTTSSSDWLSSSIPTGAGHDTDCYDLSAINSNGGSGWARWFYLGGPGGDNTGCN
jgi:hypothetical protein